MSWLYKVSEMAGKAEDMLNRLDQSTGDVISQTQENLRKAKSRSSSYAQLNNTHGEVALSITEEVGAVIPSHTQSEYVGGAPPRRKMRESAAPSTSHISRDDQLMQMLEQPGRAPASTRSQGPNHENWSRQSQSGNVNGVNAPSESRSRRSSGQSVASQAVSEVPDTSSLRTQLLAKDSQLAMLRMKLNESEKKMEKRSEEVWDLKREKETLQKELLEKAQPAESVEELRLARQKAVESREAVVNESAQLRKRILAIEEDNGQLNDQLRLAKFNLSENKREFDEYKEKARKILQAKERLVESLKQEGSSNGDNGVCIQAELEEVKVERDMARADLESIQLQMYNLRSEMDEGESRLRDMQRELSDERRSILEERSQWNASIQLLNEKIECARIEGEFVRAEMRRQESDYERKIEEKDREIRKAADESRSRRREEEYRSGSGVGDMGAAERLLQKQTELEQALRDNHILNIKLERIQKSSRDTVINMDSVPLSQPGLRGSLQVQNQTAKRALSLVDMICFKFTSMLRNYPAARLFIVVYFLVVHLWVFFIIMTYTPEIHP